MKILSKHGYNIDYEENIPKGANTIIIAMHGFCGDKTSGCISQLQNEALKNNIMGEVMYKQILTQGFFSYGFERKINISNEFVNELHTNDIENLYEDKVLKNVTIIHGDIDDVVPYDDSKDFSARHHTKLYTIKNADHRYKKIGQIDEVVDITINIINDKVKT